MDLWIYSPPHVAEQHENWGTGAMLTYRDPFLVYSTFSYKETPLGKPRLPLLTATLLPSHTIGFYT